VALNASTVGLIQIRSAVFVRVICVVENRMLTCSFCVMNVIWLIIYTA